MDGMFRLRPPDRKTAAKRDPQRFEVKGGKEYGPAKALRDVKDESLVQIVERDHGYEKRASTGVGVGEGGRPFFHAKALVA